MDWLIYWIIAAGVVAFIASARGRSGWGFFALSVLLSPLLGLIVLLATPGPKAAAAAAAERRGPCWQCKELVIVGASQCRFCGARLTWSNEATPTSTS